jgi:hypothetical protein
MCHAQGESLCSERQAAFSRFFRSRARFVFPYQRRGFVKTSAAGVVSQFEFLGVWKS